LFSGLLLVRLHQRRKSDIWLDLRKRYNALLSFQPCIWAGREPLGFAAKLVAA
jgi:hypothetical protein